MPFEPPVVERRLPFPSRLPAVLGPGDCRLGHGFSLLALSAQRVSALQAPLMW